MVEVVAKVKDYRCSICQALPLVARPKKTHAGVVVTAVVAACQLGAKRAPRPILCAAA